MSKKTTTYETDKHYNLEHGDIRGQFKLWNTKNGVYECYSSDLNKKIRLPKAQFIAALAKFEETEAAILAGTAAPIAIGQGQSGEVGLVHKVFRPLGKPKTAAQEVEKSSASEFDRLKREWIKENVERYNEDYREEITAKVNELELGASYFEGSGSYGYYKAFIIDGIFTQPHKYRKERKEPNLKEYFLKVREWNWDTKSWGKIQGKIKEYWYKEELEDFIKNVKFPKLSKTPDLLWEEAEKALETGNVEMYAMDKMQSDDKGPDTQLMHIGSKASLIAVQKDLEAKRSHAVAIQRSMKMIIEAKKRQLERIKEKMEGMIVAMNKQIKKIMRVVTTIELYLGIEEEIVQIQEGPTANENEPICIRQGLMFMDEEVGDPWDDGQGLEWNRKGIAAFDDWLTRNDNYKKVVPEKKGIAAFQARRDFKQRANHGNPFANLSKMQADMQTFLLIRNGDNLYRLITDKIAFRPRLFPRRDELQRLFDYWKIADAIEKKKADPEAWMSLEHLSDKDKERFSGFKSSDHRNVGDAKEFAEDSVFFYKMRITLFQGLIDRATILHPLKPNCEYKLFSPAAQEDGLVRLIYDDELTLPSGRKPFWTWLKDLNSTIDHGSRIVLSHNWGYLTTVGGHQEMEEYGYKRADEMHVERLDDRYGSGHSGNWSHIPPRPQEGMYFVKKGERWKNEPVWIDNPHFNPDLLETYPDKEYSPELNREYWPKDPKVYNRHGNSSDVKNYHYELNPRIKMTYAEQIAYFGKVVEKGLHPTDEEKNKTGVWMHGILKNPRKIHRYSSFYPKSKEWRNGKYVDSKELRPKYDWHDVKHHFMCIRYNPKDKVGEYKMIRRWDDEDPTERKLNISWKIYESDAFIINYDAITVEDIDFYLESRIDRRHYMHMMPLLMQVKKTLLEEKKGEIDFKKLVAGEVHKKTGMLPDDGTIDQQVEAWKKNLKWKRAISHDDSKALRMIVDRICKQYGVKSSSQHQSPE